MTQNKEQNRLPGSSSATYGAYLGLAVALAMLAYAVTALFGGGDAPMPLKLAFLIGGAVQAAVCYFSLRRSRPAWSFALSLNGTLAVVFFFGATKVRDGFGVNLELAFIPCGVFALITVLLAMGGDDY